MSRVGVLMVAPLPKHIVEPLEAEFTVYRLWQPEDRDLFLGEVADDVRGIATSGMDGADAALIGALPKLEIISCFGVGVDPIDLDAAAAHDVIVTNTPDVLTDDVADLALALMLAVTRRLAEGDRFVRAGRWLKGNLPLGTKMAGRTVGIVGLGRIGQATARRAEACGMTVVYHGPRHKPDQPYRYYDDLRAMAADADILVVTCPGGEATHHIVDAAVLEALGPDGILINVARGSVVDEPALVRALEDGRLGGAGLDVFEDEPRVPEALIGLDNVVLLPHLGSATVETRRAMCDLVVENLRRHFAGQPVLTPVR
ncbi:MAG: 2-hydroxyacid dehydrogenase [Kiloniellales bacterium]